MLRPTRKGILINYINKLKLFSSAKSLSCMSVCMNRHIRVRTNIHRKKTINFLYLSQNYSGFVCLKLVILKTAALIEFSFYF